MTNHLEKEDDLISPPNDSCNEAIMMKAGKVISCLSKTNMNYTRCKILALKKGRDINIISRGGIADGILHCAPQNWNKPYKPYSDSRGEGGGGKVYLGRYSGANYRTKLCCSTKKLQIRRNCNKVSQRMKTGEGRKIPSAVHYISILTPLWSKCLLNAVHLYRGSCRKIHISECPKKRQLPENFSLDSKKLKQKLANCISWLHKGIHGLSAKKHRRRSCHFLCHER